MDLVKVTTTSVTAGHILKLTDLKSESGTIKLKLDTIQNPGRTSPLAIKGIKVSLFYDAALMD